MTLPIEFPDPIGWPEAVVYVVAILAGAWVLTAVIGWARDL